MPALFQITSSQLNQPAPDTSSASSATGESGDDVDMQDTTMQEDDYTPTEAEKSLVPKYLAEFIKRDELELLDEGKLVGHHLLRDVLELLAQSN